jgi:hypothetical protein
MIAVMRNVCVGSFVEARAEPILNPVTKAPHRARVTLPNGFEYTEAEYGKRNCKA